MAITQEPDRTRRRRFSPLLWTSSLGAMAILSLGVTGTLSQFTASITNDTNEVATAPAAAFGFSEAVFVGGILQPVCADASAGEALTCPAVNKYGTDGAAATPIAPDGTRITTVQLENTGVDPGAITGILTLSAGACTQLPAVDPVGSPIVGDLCGTATVAIACTTTGTIGAGVPVGTTTLTAFGTASTTTPVTVATLAPGDTVDCTFTTTQPSNDPTLQGITATQPMTWTFTQSV
jgi:hypothetical protein